MKRQSSTNGVVLDVLVANLNGGTQERRAFTWTPEHEGFQCLLEQ